MGVEGGVSFSKALDALKSGSRIARVGWNGKGMWLRLVTSRGFVTIPGENDEGSVTLSLSPYIEMKTADGCLVPWLASQTDLLAEDWWVVG
jgi:hypothetical protein